MRKVTYGVAGLIDWNAKIPVGKASLSVHFTGGALTKYGVTPAEFATADPVVQHIIEHSGYYTSGRISTLRVSEVCAPPGAKRVAVKTADSTRTAAREQSRLAAGSGAVVEVGCLEDAAEYLREKFGVPSVNLRNRASIDENARQNNVTFKYPDGV